MEKALKCGVLHRDISLGNIMISPDGRGLLIDWDHAGETTRSEGYEHQKFCTVRSLPLIMAARLI